MRSLLAAVLLAAAIPALAAKPKPGKGHDTPGGPPDPKAMAAQRAEHLTRELNLSDDQATKIKAIMEDSSGEEIDLMKKLRDRQRKTHESIRSLLDEEQKEKFDSMRPPRGMAMGGGDEGRRPHPMRPPVERQERGGGDGEARGHGQAHDDGNLDRPGVMIDTGDAPEKPGTKPRDD